MCETRIINFMTQIPDEGTPETNIRSKKKTCTQHWALSKPFDTLHQHQQQQQYLHD
jgi:hypothetical protein